MLINGFTLKQSEVIRQDLEVWEVEVDNGWHRKYLNYTAGKCDQPNHSNQVS